MSFESVITRLADLRRDTGAGSMKIKQALLRIGTTLQAQMILNAPIRKGRLRSSIKYIVTKTGDGQELSVGSFGVPYAAVIEYGYNGIQQIRAHSVKAHQRLTRARSSVKTRTTFAGGTQTVRQHQVRQHPRNVKRAARPFIRPAVDKHSQFIIDMIRTIAEPS